MTYLRNSRNSLGALSTNDLISEFYEIKPLRSPHPRFETNWLIQMYECQVDVLGKRISFALTLPYGLNFYYLLHVGLP